MYHKSWRPGFFAIIVDTYVFFPITTPLRFPLHSRCRARLIRVCESSARRRGQKSYIARLALARLDLARDKRGVGSTSVLVANYRVVALIERPLLRQYWSQITRCEFEYKSE